MFSFLNLTLFRPECEANVSFKARWMFEVGTPAVLVYIVIVVWFVHRFCLQLLLTHADDIQPVIAEMCSQGQVLLQTLHHCAGAV